MSGRVRTPSSSGLPRPNRRKYINHCYSFPGDNIPSDDIGLLADVLRVLSRKGLNTNIR